MEIRKLYRFEAAHIVRGCTSERCKYSLHGHSYALELFLTAEKLDQGQMIYDFGLLKGFPKVFIDSFDHATMFWDDDDPEYVNFIRKHSERHISLPFSPSAEMLSLFFLKALRFLLDSTKMQNDEGRVAVHSVRLHETAAGYAQSYLHDLENENFPEIALERVEFSDAIQKDWHEKDLWKKLVRREKNLENPLPS